MNESSSDNASESDQEQIATLRHQLTSTLMLVAGIAVIITWFFAYEAWFRYHDSSRAAQAANEMAKQLDEFTHVNEPQFREAVRKLQEYSKTHPDVLPILNKYGVMQITNAPAPVPKK